jgi:hypothetical protein
MTNSSILTISALFTLAHLSPLPWPLAVHRRNRGHRHAPVRRLIGNGTRAAIVRHAEPDGLFSAKAMPPSGDFENRPIVGDSS